MSAPTRSSGERAPLEAGGARRFGSYELCPTSGMASDAPQALSNADKPRKVPVKIDPKVFFANERTFLAWLHMSLMIGSMAIGIITLSASSGQSRLYGLVMLPVAVAFALYALRQYHIRLRAIRRRESGPYEDRRGPYFLGGFLIIATATNLAVHVSATY
ncbi:hypothetical protein M885DRAFT_533452 [Pelagophyceae sp. CCMP2097]|nr:hypothetical protein M885DRAFT_533452 [Pelagophyceae sp. CCMP2097]|mmetsp:Transcript_788/g.2935  ORF Transcript_788/g.2935 Transcript_788/m.2935 type:complete len:160 (+) Transcript_788:49-528(+)